MKSTNIGEFIQQRWQILCRTSFQSPDNCISQKILVLLLSIVQSRRAHYNCLLLNMFKSKTVIVPLYDRYLFAVVGPLIINILYKRQAPFDWLSVEWDSSAALTYYGTIIASIIAVFGVFLTIRY